MYLIKVLILEVLMLYSFFIDVLIWGLLVFISIMNISVLLFLIFFMVDFVVKGCLMIVK